MTAETDVRYVGAARPNRAPLGGAPARADLPGLYQTVRLRIGPAAVLLTLTVGTVTGWPNGPWVPISAVAVTLHAIYVHRNGTPGPFTLLIDGAALVLATLAMSIPVVTAAAFSFFAVIASILMVGRRSIVVALFTAGWVAASLAWAYAGFHGPYEQAARVTIEMAAVSFFAVAISVIVAVVMRRLRRTQQQHLEAVDELRESNARLGDLLEAKDRFVASISHELRTPLTAVVGLSHELADPDTQFDGAEADEMQQMVAREAKEVAAIVEDLLVAARTDIGEVSIFAKPVPLSLVVNETLDAIDVSDRLVRVVGDGVVHADPVRVRQILRNLLTNCLRYGGDTIDVRIASTDGEVHVEVRDNGPGVDPSRVETLFDPYEAANQDNRHVKSVGLGLSVSQTLADLMSGDLVYRREDEWTVFELSLPAAR